MVDEVTIKDQVNHEKWIPKEGEPTEYKKEICNKNEHAPGVDSYHNAKISSCTYITKLTDFIKAMFEEG